MARRSYSRGRSTRAPARRSTRSSRAPARRNYAPARRSTARSARRTAAVGRTVRIVIEQPSANPLARPELIGKMPAGTTMHRTRSRF